MATSARMAVLLLCAGVAFLGVALGAASQREVFLHIEGEGAADGQAAGNLVFLTALLVGLGAGSGAWVLSRQRGARAAGAAALAGAAAYVLTVVLQSAYPFFVALEERRVAVLAVNPLLHNSTGYASVLLPGFAILLGAVLAAGAAGRRLFAPPTGQPDAGGLLREHVSAVAVAAPFVLVAGVGALQVFAGLREAGYDGPRVVFLPVVSLLCAALLCVAGLKAWHLAAATRNSRLGALVASEWRRLGRIEAALLAALAAVTLLGALDDAVDLPGLQVGATLALKTRGHLAFLLLSVLVAYVPMSLLHRRARAALEGPAPAGGAARATLETGGLHPASVALAAALVASAALAGLAAWLAAGNDVADLPGDGALWPWLGALAPLALVALRFGTPGLGTVPTVLAAVTLWGIGNTVAASFDGYSDGLLQHRTDPEILSLWRVAAALLLGAAVVRLARCLAGPRPVPWYLSGGLAVALGTLLLLELPFGAWVLSGAIRGESVALGSVVAAQDPAVRVSMHALALAAALAAAWAVARLHRPEWFGRRGRPLPAVLRVAAPRPAGTAAGAAEQQP